jgi:hypothetical protein
MTCFCKPMFFKNPYSAYNFEFHDGEKHCSDWAKDYVKMTIIRTVGAPGVIVTINFLSAFTFQKIAFFEKSHTKNDQT